MKTKLQNLALPRVSILLFEMRVKGLSRQPPRARACACVRMRAHLYVYVLCARASVCVRLCAFVCGCVRLCAPVCLLDYCRPMSVITMLSFTEGASVADGK